MTRRLTDEPVTRYGLVLPVELIDGFKRACRLESKKPPVVVRELMQSYINTVNKKHKSKGEQDV